MINIEMLKEIYEEYKKSGDEYITKSEMDNIFEEHGEDYYIER